MVGSNLTYSPPFLLEVVALLRSRRTSRILLAALSLAWMAPLQAALRPDDVPLEGRLFDIKLFRFNNTKDKVLLEQYFRKNIVNYREHTGAFLETVEHNRSRVLKEFSEAKRGKLIRGWLDGLQADHPDLATRFDAARLYLSWAELADRPKGPTVSEGLALRAEAVKVLEGLEVSPWSQLVAGLIVDLVGTGNANPPAIPTTLVLWERAGESAKQQDAHLHFLLGDLITAVADPTSIPEYCKKIATEYEKALLILPSDKQLYAAVAGRYHEIYERLNSDDKETSAIPFWFEELVFKRLIAVEPTNARAHNNLSYLYSHYGVNLKEALKEAQIANQLQPDDPNMLDTLGWAYYKQGNAKKAIEIFRRALSLDDSLADVHFHIATVLYDEGQLDEAVHHFRTTSTLDPTNAFARNNLAYLFSERGTNLKEALALVDEALELSPQNSAFLDTKGWIFYGLGRYDEADAFVSKAIALQSEVSELHMHAGQIALARGRYQDASNHFEKAITYDPQNSKLARDLARIYALDGLKQGLTRFSKIRAVNVSKDNFEVFYRSMAEIYQTDRMYQDAIGVLTRFQELANGDPLAQQDSAPPALEDSTGKTPKYSPKEDYQSTLQTLPTQTDLAFTLERDGLLGLLDLAIQYVKTPFPLAAFQDQIAARLPQRVVFGFDSLLAENETTPAHVAMIQFEPAHRAQYSQKLLELGENKVQIPGIRHPVHLKTWTYKSFQLGTMSIPGIDAHYAVLKDTFVFSRRKSALIALLDQPAGEQAPLTKDSGFKDFVERLEDSSQATMVGHLPALLQSGAGSQLSEAEIEFLKKLSVVCSQYQLDLGSDSLKETSMLYAAPGEDLTGMAKQAEGFAKSSVKRFPGAEDLDIQTTFGEVEGRIQGNVRIQGVREWLLKLFKRVTHVDVDLPDLELESTEDLEDEDQGDPSLEDENPDPEDN